MGWGLPEGGVCFILLTEDTEKKEGWSSQGMTSHLLIIRGRAMQRGSVFLEIKEKLGYTVDEC
jgi:hypothetical protein